jgi:Fe-S cluster assembly protein SufD
MMDTLTQMERKPATAFFPPEGEPASGPAWLQSLRQKARMRLNDLEFPTTDHEEWRFTNVSPLAQWPLKAPDSSARQVTPAEVAPHRLEGGGFCLVFVDGRFRKELSTMPDSGAGFRAGNLGSLSVSDGAEVEKNLARHVPADANYFTALNTARFEDGAFVFVPANAAIAESVQLLYIATGEQPGAAVHVRNLVVAEQASSIKIIESYVSLAVAPNFTNAVTELVLAADARIEHCRLQNENEQTFHIAWVQAEQARNSHFLSHSIATGARLARNQIQTRLNAEGAEAILNGLYLARGEQLIDHHTVVDHAKPHCESHEFYFGILSGRAHGVFNGKIFVRQDAQKTNAKQTNRNLVLSEHALINTKPQLEIFADDVKCTHGATVGQLNEEALFYLRARGLGEALARRMLVRAFANDAVERITLAPVREHLEKVLTDRFEGLDTSLSSHGR